MRQITPTNDPIIQREVSCPPRHIPILLVCAVTIAAGCLTEDRQPDVDSTFFEVPGSWRAVEVVEDSEAWFASSKGQWLRILKNTEVSIQQTFDDGYYDADRSKISKHYRGLAKTSDALMGTVIGSPALIKRATFDTSGKLAEIRSTVWREDHPNAFLDAILVLDDQTIIAMGDPIDNCLYVVRSTDGGRTWSKVPCIDDSESGIPLSIKNEAAFAASNGNLSAIGDTVWMLSGGGASRVYRSENKGVSWQVFETPLQHGGEMTGGFSMDFADAQHGIIWGGNWKNKTDNNSRAAVTSDGGMTWTLIADGKGPGYASAVRYRPGSGGRQIALIGAPGGIDVSDDAGATWRHVSDSAFYAGRFSPDGTTLWLGGEGRIARFNAASLGW